MKIKRIISLALAMLMLLTTAMFVSCSAVEGNKSDNYYSGGASNAPSSVPNEDLSYDYSESVKEENGSIDFDIGAPDSVQKIIWSCSMVIETKEIEQAVKSIEALAGELGGYIQSSEINGKSEYSSYPTERKAYFTVRVPADKLNGYIDTISEKYNVTSKNTSSQDITDTYYDIQSRLNSLITQEERIISMLEKADTLEYILQLEDKLSEIRYEIENYSSSLQRYDKLVSYATITITLREVVEYTEIIETPKTFGERIAAASKQSWANFRSGCENFAVGFVYNLPGFIIFVIVVLIFVLIIAAIVKSSKKRAAKRREQYYREYCAAHPEAAPKSPSAPEKSENDGGTSDK